MNLIKGKEEEEEQAIIPNREVAVAVSFLGSFQRQWQFSLPKGKRKKKKKIDRTKTYSHRKATTETRGIVKPSRINAIHLKNDNNPAFIR